jgi:pyruvate carboxylase
MKIKKLMCTNRGEIAIRVFRACTELGIRTVAIYSEEDRYSLHRYKADEAYLVGKGLDPIAAYMNIDELVDLAKRHNVDAIHPGYGFLAESYEFAEACEKSGIIFIGPKPHTMKLFGDKKLAKDLAKSCNVPVIGGSEGIVADLSEAKVLVNGIGYPVLLKATARGGGRGIRVCKNDKELEEKFEYAMREALKSFGKSDLIIE